MDMTDRQRADEALRISEGLLRVAMQAGRHGLYDLDLRTGRAVVNDAYARMLGYDPATFVETNDAWRARLHPDDRDTVFGEFEAYVAGRRESFRVEFRQRTASGAWHWVLSVGEIVERDAEGAQVRMLGTHTDIQASKEVEEALRQSEDRFRRAVEAAPVAVFIQTHGRFAYLNPAALGLFGATRTEQLVGTPVLEHFAVADRAAVADRVRRLNEAHESVETRLERLVRLDGLEVEAEFSAVPFQHGDADGALVFARDVTDRMQSERQLRAHLDELRRWQSVMLDREDRVQALKREVNALCRRIGEAPRYASQDDEVPPP